MGQSQEIDNHQSNCQQCFFKKLKHHYIIYTVTECQCWTSVPKHIRASRDQLRVSPQNIRILWCTLRVAFYGTECWPATSKYEQALHVMEMQMLQRCLGVTRSDHVMNDDIHRRLGITAFMAKFQEGKLKWYGHIINDRNSHES